MRAKEFIFNNYNDFKTLVDKKDISISKMVIDSIKRNIKNRKPNVELFSIKCLAEGDIYDVSLEKKYFKQTLKENLPYFETKEMYEDCNQIKQIMSLIKD